MSERIGALTIGDDEVIRDGDGGGNDGGNSAGDGGNIVDPSSVEPPKRGRGRPRKSGSGEPGKSGSKPGSIRNAAKTTQKTAAVSVDALAFIVNMVGGFVAAKTKQELLALEPEESRTIAEAAANVAKHYNVPVNEKTAAWIGLVTAVGTIYGSKIAAIKLAKAINK